MSDDNNPKDKSYSELAYEFLNSDAAQDTLLPELETVKRNYEHLRGHANALINHINKIIPVINFTDGPKKIVEIRDDMTKYIKDHKYGTTHVFLLGIMLLDVAMRSMEQSVAHLERRKAELEAQGKDITNITHPIINPSKTVH